MQRAEGLRVPTAAGSPNSSGDGDGEADGGTLFLDEVGESPLAAQAKLLRVLQEGKIERLGADRTRRINVRPVEIPPLRERPSDIPLLVQGMLDRFCALHSKRLLGITDKAMDAIKSHRWPGNVRELENIIERGVILAPQLDWIQLEHLAFGRGEGATAQAGECIGAGGGLERPRQGNQPDLCATILRSGLSLDDLEQQLIHHAVDQAGGNLAGAARILGITRPQLSYRLKKATEPELK